MLCVGWVIDMRCRYGCWRLVGFCYARYDDRYPVGIDDDYILILLICTLNTLVYVSNVVLIYKRI